MDVSPMHSHVSPSYSSRVAVLVDVQSLFYAAKGVLHRKIEYGRFLQGVVRNRALTRAVAYIIQYEVNSDAFCEALLRQGYELKIEEPRLNLEVEFQPRWSWAAGISVDAVAIAPRVDTLILASCDGAMTPVVKTLVQQGVRVEVAGIERGTSPELMRAASAFVPIRPEWMLQPRAALPETVARRNAGYEGLPDDAELDRESAAMAQQQGSAY